MRRLEKDRMLNETKRVETLLNEAKSLEMFQPDQLSFYFWKTLHRNILTPGAVMMLGASTTTMVSPVASVPRPLPVSPEQAYPENSNPNTDNGDVPLVSPEASRPNSNPNSNLEDATPTSHRKRKRSPCSTDDFPECRIESRRCEILPALP